MSGARPLTLRKLRAWLQRPKRRGRPRLVFGKLDEKYQRVARLIEEALARGPLTRGAVVELQKRAQDDCGITSSEFYKLRQQHKGDALLATMRLIRSELSPAERDQWRDRWVASLARLARRRAARRHRRGG